MKTGDVLLYKGKGPFSQLIMVPFEADYSHVEIVIRYGGKLCTFGSTSLGILADVITGKKICGVQIVPFDLRVSSYDGEVFHRPIHGVRTLTQHTALDNFIAKHHGKPYEQSNWELVNAEIDGPLPWHVNKPDDSSLFCSETACMALRAMNIMLTDNTPANEFTPSDFARDISMRDGYSFGDLSQLN